MDWPPFCSTQRLGDGEASLNRIEIASLNKGSYLQLIGERMLHPLPEEATTCWGTRDRGEWKGIFLFLFEGSRVLFGVF